MVYSKKNEIIESLLTCLDNAVSHTYPYKHWLLSTILTRKHCDRLLDLPLPPAEIKTLTGRREENNQTRIFLTSKKCSSHSICQDLIQAFKEQQVLSKIERLCDIDISKGHLRIEYTQDVDGFWLEPHTDIGEKLFTMLVYLSSDSEPDDAGTDIFDSDHNWVGRAPFKQDNGLIFIPGSDTWHGFVKRPLAAVRRSIIVNFVTDNWRERWELAL